MHEKEERPDQRLRELCTRAAKEQDSKKLMQLVKQIIDTYDAQQAKVSKKAGEQPESKT